MVNGVMHIVAAVLFAVVAFQNQLNKVWLVIAGVYLATGIVNLTAHAIRLHKIEKAAKKAELNNLKSTPQKTEEGNVAGG